MKQEKSSRPNLPKVSEEMKAWSAALAAEVDDWPQLSARSFFGFTALYRKDKIFAALPRTRAMGKANSPALKLVSPASAAAARLKKDPRIGSMDMQKMRWYTFELSSDSDLHDALDWLGRAYEAAGKKRSS
jgi:TfoX/Sxy family transcriptional regulator of competence genes